MKIRCKKCDVVFEGEPDDMFVIACSSCGYRMRVRPTAEDPSAGSQGAPPGERKTGSLGRVTPSGGVPSRTPSASVPSKTPSASVPAGGPKLPTTMRANKLIAGRQCMGCGETIALGQEVHNCEACGTPSHESCWAAKGSCPNAACQGALAIKGDAGPSGAPADDGEESKPCKYCGETIKSSARKCRFCGEYQNARDRAAQDKAQTAAATSASDSELSIVDWVLCLVGVGCIVGIIYALMGKKKAGKVILVAIVCNVLTRGLLALIVSSR